MTPDPTGDPIESVTYEPEFYRLTIDTVGGWSLTIENDFAMEVPGSFRIESTANADQIVSRLMSHIGLPLDRVRG